MKIAVFLKFYTVCPLFLVYSLKIAVAGFYEKLLPSRQTAVPPVAFVRTSKLSNKLDNCGMMHFDLGLSSLLDCAFPRTSPVI